MTVKGYLSFGSHARQLWQSRQALNKDSEDGCVTLVGTGNFSNTLRQMNGRIITVRGTARRDVTSGRVDYGACGNVGLEMSSIVN